MHLLQYVLFRPEWEHDRYITNVYTTWPLLCSLSLEAFLHLGELKIRIHCILVKQWRSHLCFTSSKAEWKGEKGIIPFPNTPHHFIVLYSAWLDEKYWTEPCFSTTNCHCCLLKATHYVSIKIPLHLLCHTVSHVTHAFPSHHSMCIFFTPSVYCKEDAISAVSRSAIQKPNGEVLCTP